MGSGDFGRRLGKLRRRRTRDRAVSQWSEHVGQLSDGTLTGYAIAAILAYCPEVTEVITWVCEHDQIEVIVVSDEALHRSLFIPWNYVDTVKDAAAMELANGGPTHVSDVARAFAAILCPESLKGGTL